MGVARKPQEGVLHHPYTPGCGIDIAVDESKPVADGVVVRFRESAQSVANIYLHTIIDSVSGHSRVAR